MAAKPATSAKAKPSETKSEPKSGNEAGPKTAAAARPPQPKHPSDEAAAQPEKPAKDANLMTGAQPSVPSGSFDNRWGQFR